MVRVGDARFSRRAATLLSVPLVVLLLMLAAHAASAQALNMTGKWQGAYHCEAGWCAGQEFPATTEFYEAAGCADVIGSNGSESITGTLVGNVFTSASEVGSYKSESSQTLSADGNHLEGKGHDNNGTSGTSVGTRVSSSSAIAPYSECKHPSGEKQEEVKKAAASTGVTVMCDYDPLTSQDACTAVVADSSGPGATRPTGSVTFASAGGGFFPFGKTCTLSTSPSAPSTGFCSVAFIPAAGAGFPNLSAAYPGDATHAAATGSTRFIVPGGEPAGYEASSTASGYPNELSVEVNVPAAHSELQAGVSKGETAPPRPPGKQLRASEDPNIVPSMRSEVEEREREERYPDIVPSMRKEVEEREIEYERDVQRIHREVNEAKQHAAGLGTAAQTEQNAALAADSAVIAQIAAQEKSPDLKKDPASAAVLAKLAKQSQELQKAIGEIVELQRHEAEGAIKGVGSSLTLAGVARARAHHGKLVALGHVRVVAVSAGKVKLKIRLKRSTLARLARGKRSLTLNLRVVMVMPSQVVKSGLPVGIVRHVTLHTAALHHHKH